jgi:hypothetical protein
MARGMGKPGFPIPLQPAMVSRRGGGWVNLVSPHFWNQLLKNGSGRAGARPDPPRRARLSSRQAQFIDHLQQFRRTRR